MRKLVVLVVAGVLLLAMDAGFRLVAQSAAADLIERRVGRGVDPEVGIGGFPFLVSAVRGEFDAVDVSIPRLANDGMDVEDVELTFRDVSLEPLRVVAGQGAIEAGTLRGQGRITEGNLNAAVARLVPDVELAIARDRVTITRSGSEVTANVVIAGDALVVDVGAAISPVELPLPEVLPGVVFGSVQARADALVVGIRGTDVTIRS